MALSISGGEEVSLSEAQKNERNILARLQQYQATNQLYQNLWHERKSIEAIAAHHLAVAGFSACTVQPMDTWMKGQFNVCILLNVQDGDGRVCQKIFRCPMPHKVGEQAFPGAAQEKARAEIAAYAWIENNCPEIPIPILYAFGVSNGLQFTHYRYESGYFRDPINIDFNRPYLLLEFIDRQTGQMLSDTLSDYRVNDPIRMENLCRGISRIMLSLARKSQSCIGSLRLNDDGSTTLANRPILCTNSILESEGAPRIVDRTYTTVGSFIDDMIRFRDESFRAQPNAVNDEEDCHLQMLHMVLLRLLKYHFTEYQSEGPFVLQLTDLHPSNIFVDEQWNIVALIDLEFICALPPSMMSVPYWLTVDAIDEVSDNKDTFDKMHETFMNCFRDEEGRNGGNILLASSIEKAWDTCSCWFYRCLTSINGMACCLEDHIYGKFGINLSIDEEKSWATTMSAFWSLDFKKDVEQKLQDKAKYNKDLELYFERSGRAANNTSAPLSSADIEDDYFYLFLSSFAFYSFQPYISAPLGPPLPRQAQSRYESLPPRLCAWCAEDNETARTSSFPTWN